MKKSILLFTVVWVAIFGRLYAQEITVSGKVTASEDGSAIPGVNVVVKGTSTGAVTDIEGRYQIDVPSQESILVFSYIGYLSEEIVVGNQSTIDVALTQDVTQLEELVIIGYGTQKKKDVSSSIATVDAEQIKDMPNYSFDGALQGLASGVNISTPSATPGAAINVNIRGTTSINASSQPLYIIDGIPIAPENKSSLNSNIQPTNPLADINPADIESFTVLKDASAAAIYGSRGANGVIVITTKRGSSGKTKINANYYYGVSQVNNVPEMMNANEWIGFLNVAAENDGLGENYWGDPNDPSLTTTDVYDEIFRTAATQNFDISMQGGNDKTQFFLSANYFDQEGVQIGQGYNRFSTRLNLDHNISRKVKIGANLSLSRSFHQRTINENDEYGVIINSQAWDPTAPLRDENGNYTNPFSFNGWWALENPLVIANEYVNESTSNRFLGSTFLEWEILEGLSFKTSLNLDYNYFVDEGFVPKGFNQTDEGLGDFASWEESNVINENTLSYSRIFDKHNLNVLVGYTWQVQDIDQSVIFGQGYPSNRKYKLINATTITSALTDAETYGLVSYLGRVSYGYDDRYLLQLTVRRDGSSRFGPDSRFGNFPSASFAWRLSNEEFMQGTSNWLSELKPRISYGVIGNQEIGNNVWQARWNLSSPYNELGGSQPSNLENANLGWESTAQLNVGIDIGLFNNRFSIVADYFNKQTEDLLLATNVPGNTGYKTVFANAGTIENKGFEIALTSTNIDAGDFTWTSNFNFTTLENNVVEVVNDGQLLSRNFILKEGESLSSLYLVRFLGVDPTTGDALFEDINSDGEINQDDRQIVGQGIPTYFGGFDNNFTYKGFSLRVFFQFSGGKDIFNQSRFAYENYGAFPGSASIPYGNYNKRSLDYWKEPGDVTSIPRPSHAREGSSDAQFYRFSTQYLEDGSFVRLKNVRLAYTFPKEWISSAGLNSLTLYFSGQNLYTWTKYLGFDPEINTNTASAESLNTLQGEDFGTLGQARTFMFGINIGL